MIRKYIPKLSRKQLIIGGIGLLVVGGILYSAFGKDSQPSAMIFSGDPYTVDYGDIHEVLSFDGTTSFSDSQKLTFGQQGLKVTQVLVQLGDKVKKDQVLATLESTDVDANFKTAQSSLALAKLNYEKTLGMQDKDSDLLKAQNELSSAESNLRNIEAAINLTNQEEDNNIDKARQVLADAQEDYENLTCDNCSNSDEKIRNQRNTYKSAIEDLRSIANTAQSTLDSLDNLMYFSSKYNNTAGSKERSAYIGYNNPSTITTTQNSFTIADNLLTTLENTYSTLSSKDIDSITLNEMRTAYNEVDTLSQALMTLGNDARSMFNASLVGWGIAGQGSNIDQATVDNYVTLANTIYNSGKTLNTQGSATMERIYNLDNNSTESNINKAKQAVDTAQLNLDKLLLSKANRITNNQTQRTQAQVAVNTAKLNIKAIQGGYFDTSVQAARNQLIQAQSSVDQMRKRYESYQLIANFDGTVREMNIQVGDTVNTESNTYIYVENPNLIETTLELDQLDILKIERGDEATVTLDILKNQSFSGIVSEVNTIPTIKNNKTTYIVKVLSEKPENVSLVGGMSANVTFTKDTKQNVLVIPTTALSYEDGKAFVMSSNNIKKEVTIGSSDNSFSEVLSGLQLGDSIFSLTISEDQMTQAGVSSKIFDPNANPFEEGGSAGIRKSGPQGSEGPSPR